MQMIGQVSKAVIEKYRALNKDVYSDDGAKTLDVASLKTLYKWKYKKTPKAGLNKTHLLAAWNDAKDSTSNINNICTWTEEDQVELDTLENKEIKLSDTEVGRQAGKVINDAISVLSSCSKPQLEKLQDAISNSSPVTESQDEDQVIELQDTIVPVPNQKFEEENI